MAILLHLITWILYLTHADGCDTIVGGPLNGTSKTGGPWLNIFPDLRIPIDGFLTQITFRKKASGIGYVSFWKWKEDRTYEMMAMFPIQTTGNDSDIITVDISQRVFLERNLSIALHSETGIFVYEEGGNNVYAENLRDDTLQIGGNVTFTGMPLMKSPALELVICETCEPVSLGPLISTSSGGPWLTLFPDIRTPISGWVTSIAFIRRQNRTTAYISFWQWVHDKEYAIKAKVQLRTNSLEAADFVYVERNWSVAIHHLNQDGAVHFNDEGHNAAYLMDVRDGDLPINRTVDFNNSTMQNKSAAVTFTICICRLESHCESNNCDPASGLCIQGCEPGYQGDYCDKVCRLESHCESNNSDPASGLCIQGCEPGYQGDYCDKVCESPQFGENCNSTCHCLNSTECYPVNGTCHLGGCEDGYEGDSCSVEVVPTTLAATRGFPTEEPDPSIETDIQDNKEATALRRVVVGLAVGFTLAVVLLSVVTVILCRWFIRKKTKDRHGKNVHADPVNTNSNDVNIKVTEESYAKLYHHSQADPQSEYIELRH